MKLCPTATYINDNLHNGIDASAVSFPHGPEARLAADVPHFDGHVALGDFAHVEAHRGDHVLAELARLKAENRDVSKKGRLPRTLAGFNLPRSH